MTDEIKVPGKLKVLGPGKYQVVFTSKKGNPTTSNLPVAAARFKAEDAVDGCDVEIILKSGQPSRVTIPGKPEVPAASGQERRPASPPPVRKAGAPVAGGYGKPGVARAGRSALSNHGKGATAVDTNKLPQADPSVLGSPFHNPYTFIEFPGAPCPRNEPTPLSADEEPDGPDRFTGVIELTVKTLSPLLTCQAESEEMKRARTEEERKKVKGAHQTYRALTIGDDVIVPATGIRGFLRNLITILTGGPLTHLDREMYLCQGRDLALGPRTTDSQTIPVSTFLARVISPGSHESSGVVELGDTRHVRLDVLKPVYQKCFPTERDLPRPKQGDRPVRRWASFDSDGKLAAISDKPSDEFCWELKLSGRPIAEFKQEFKQGKEVIHWKREGFFRGSGRKIDLPANLWAAYSNRNRHGMRPELEKGDLVWLEPSSPDLAAIEKPKDVKSIQWARWGRRGESVRCSAILPAHLRPDWMRYDGDEKECEMPARSEDMPPNDRKVSLVTDLLGQVSQERKAAPAFAGRVRPENLVFRGARGKLQGPFPLAPLAVPHPGCIAFYRKCSDPKAISNRHPLKGYKVYRAAQDGDKPWLFETQGIYDEKGLLQTNPRQKMNKSAQLLPPGAEGTLRIAFRALSADELAILVRACGLAWRLGGGKPLGLGRCGVQICKVLDENGDDLSGRLPSQTPAGVEERARLWTAAQQPVPLLRYPRAVSRNKNNRGGHVWFQRFASPKKGGDENEHVGVQPVYVTGDLMNKARADMTAPGQPTNAPKQAELISGQVLKPMDPDKPEADRLYGYDALLDDQARVNMDFNTKGQDCYPEIRKFDETRDVTGNEKSGGFHGQNRESRDQQKKRREDES